MHKNTQAKMYICTEYIIGVLRKFTKESYTYLAENVTANITENIFNNAQMFAI